MFAFQDVRRTIVSQLPFLSSLTQHPEHPETLPVQVSQPVREKVKLAHLDGALFDFNEQEISNCIANHLGLESFAAPIYVKVNFADRFFNKCEQTLTHDV